MQLRVRVAIIGLPPAVDASYTRFCSVNIEEDEFG